MPDPVQPEPLPEKDQPQPERLSARKRSWRKRLGNAGERDAARMLAQKGYTILLRDCRTPKGELDLVCLDGAAYVFVEVKTRSSRQFGDPQEFVDYKKQRAYINLANTYVLTKSRSEEVRFDIMAIEVSSTGYRINHIENAFSAFSIYK